MIPADRGLVYDQVLAGSGYKFNTFDGFLDPVRGDALSFRSDSGSYLFVMPKSLAKFPVEAGRTVPYNGSSVLGPADAVADTNGLRTFTNRCTTSFGGLTYSHYLYLYPQNVNGAQPDLHYSSFGKFMYIGADKVSSYTDAFFFGIGSPTTVARIPASGSATYNGKLIGHGHGTDFAFSGGDDLDGTMALTVNFAARTFTLQVNLTNRPVGSASASLGSHNFTGTLDPASANFSGTATDGKVSGFLSGPGGEEAVLAFTITIPNVSLNSIPTHPLAVAASGGAAR